MNYLDNRDRSYDYSQKKKSRKQSAKAAKKNELKRLRNSFRATVNKANQLIKQ